MKRIRNKITTTRDKLPGYTHPLAKALQYMMLLCATIHLTISLYMSLITNDINYASLWNILGLTMVFRPTPNDTLLALSGVPLMVIPWAIIAYILYRHSKQKVTVYEARPTED